MKSREKRTVLAACRYLAFNSPPLPLLSSWINSTAECVAPGPSSFFGIARSSDCAPSLMAFSGAGCTSTISPSAPSGKSSASRRQQGPRGPCLDAVKHWCHGKREVPGPRHLRRCAACSPTEQSITSLPGFGGWKGSRPRPTASKLPIGLEGKTGDQIAHSSTVEGRERWCGSPTMADHGVWVGRPAGSASRRRATWCGVRLTPTTAVGDGKHRVIRV